MPREDSMSSSGGSLTSEDEEVMSPTTGAPNTGRAFISSPTELPSSGAPGAPWARAPVSPTKKSANGHVSIAEAGTTPRTPLTGIKRFRQSVYKVMAMHRASTAITGHRHGAEPGVNTRSSSAYAIYGHIRECCEIEVVDYSAVRVSIKQFHNQGFVDFMRSQDSEREHWAKVRWINIGGISWEVIQALQEKYDLHSLSIEDVLHSRRSSRSKADYYLKHLFLHVLCHSLQEDEASPLQELGVEAPPRTASPTRMSFEEAGHEKFLPLPPNPDLENGRRPTRRKTTKKSSATQTRQEVVSALEAADKAIEALKQHEDRVQVKVRNLYLFLLRDGTIISIHQADRGFGNPVMERLKRSQTILRSSADASLLLHALLDLVVDRAIDIVDRYHSILLKLERQVLIRPKMKTVRNLHIVSGDLTLHRRTLEPIKTLIYGLRRYDLDRCIAVANSAGQGPDSVRGFLSHKAKIYLADVHDHCEFILSSLEMFENITENLISYTFNIVSYEMNEVMRRLTLATIVFLPLTLLTGYFGMNFEVMWSIKGQSDVLFWEIAIPMMIVVIPLFLWNDLVRMVHFIQKSILTKRTLEEA